MGKKMIWAEKQVIIRSLISLLFLVFFLFSCTTPEEKGLDTINEESAKEYIETLAHDNMEGRRAYSEGALKAADYIAECLRDIGIAPYKDSYFQEFKTKDIEIEENGIKYRLIPPGEKIRNILGKIEGKDTSEYVIVGAHYDHLGIYDDLTEDSIFNGADDNASGVSAVLQLAKAFKASKKQPLRTIIFAFWDAEEQGLIGSKCFVESFHDINRIKLYINFDMIGRYKKDPYSKLNINYSDTISNSIQFLNNEIKKYELNINLIPSNKPEDQAFRGGSDHASFESKNVPIIFFSTGVHDDYHKPTDHTERINWEELTYITKLSFITLFKFANLAM